MVTVGGSGVGGHLLRRVIAAYPEARRLVPGLRMVVVAGPRIDPASLPAHDGLEVHAYVHDLYQHLAACDLAVVQGGLTTCMELAAAGRPFLYFPLAHHFEQNFHVAHRLRQYNAGRRMDFATATPEVIAAAIAEEIGRQVDYRPVETDGAARPRRQPDRRSSSDAPFAGRNDPVAARLGSCGRCRSRSPRMTDDAEPPGQDRARLGAVAGDHGLLRRRAGGRAAGRPAAHRPGPASRAPCSPSASRSGTRPSGWC